MMRHLIVVVVCLVTAGLICAAIISERTTAPTHVRIKRLEVRVAKLEQDVQTLAKFFEKAQNAR